MNKLILIPLFFFTLYLNAQTDPRDGANYFKYETTLVKCEIDGTEIPNESERMKINWTFNVVEKIGSYYVINVWKFKGKKGESDEKNKKFHGTIDKPVYFKITKEVYDDVAVNYDNKGSFIFGASTNLIKIRPGNGEEGDDQIFSEIGNDFNIGASAGWLWKPNYGRGRFTGGFLLNFGFSAIKVTPQTTNDFVDSESTQGAITFSGGLIGQLDKFQIMAIVGIDLMSGEVGTEWIYSNRPWIGLGFGFNIFTTKSNEKQ